MTEEERESGTPAGEAAETEDAAGTVEVEPNPDQAADAAALQSEVARLKEELAAKQAEAQTNLERWARTQADFDNFRRRARTEKEETSRYAAENLIREILPVLDNLERALASDAQAEAWRQGVELTVRQLLMVLQGQGLAPIEALQLPFDPNLHEAVLQVESEDQAEGTVVSEVRRGYRLGDKVLRPSLVAVAKRP